MEEQVAARKIEGRSAIEVSVDERSMILISQEDAGMQQSNVVELAHFDVPLLITLLKEAATEAKNRGRPV